MSRTLVVTNDFPTRQGGIESFVRTLAGSLPPDDVVVLTAQMSDEDAAYDAGLPFPVLRHPVRTLLPTRQVALRRRAGASGTTGATGCCSARPRRSGCSLPRCATLAPAAWSGSPTATSAGGLACPAPARRCAGSAMRPTSSPTSAPTRGR